ncbi:MAG: efflux RND transporter periplasmic adaptor subunit [Elusimicrobia bacterium]|nr:efflux RND transporter periplasmic adaptor subunit [Elusimicrobiota bacterium]MDY6039809.1 efflux RND transporter periplasmic adaptor subunit [Elusimicrobiaceae bacterium]
MKKENLFKRIWKKFISLPRWKKLLLLAVILIAAYFVKAHFFAAPKAPQFRTAKIKKGDIVDLVEASGPINPVNTTTVGALVSGEILKILVDYNTPVKKGDLMAIIDPTQTQADYNQAVASLSSAKESLAAAKISFDLAKLNRTRYQELYAKEYVSKSNLEEYELAYVNAKSALNSAESAVIQAQARMDSAKKDLDNTQIISPIDGMVLSKSVSEGQSLTSGFSTPELFVLAQDLTKMQIEAKVSEADVVKIKEGQTADFTLDGYPDEKFQGTVRQVRTNYVSTSSNASSSSNTTYTVVIDVDNENGKFMPGMTATITIRTQDKKDVLLVPNEALRFSPSSNMEKYTTTGLWLLEPGKEPHRVDVKIGIIGSDKTEITEGDVKDGDRVIVRENNTAAATSSMNPPRPGGRRR